MSERTRFWLIIAAAILVAFLTGYVWQRMRANNIEDRLDETRQALVLARIEATLGAAAIEAMSGSFEISRQHASTFFTELQASLDTVPPDARQDMSQILARRDAVITALSRNDVQSGPQLAQMFRNYRSALGEPIGPTQGIVPAPVTPQPDTTAATADTAAPDTTGG